MVRNKGSGLSDSVVMISAIIEFKCVGATATAGTMSEGITAEETI